MPGPRRTAPGPKESLRLLRDRLRRHPVRLLLLMVAAFAGVGLVLQLEHVAPRLRTLLGWSARFWVALGVVHVLQLASIGLWTGVPHYHGRKRLLALVDLMLISAAVHVTGGLDSPLQPVFALQVALMGITADGDDPPGRWLAWYLPALGAAWLLPLDLARPDGVAWGRIVIGLAGLLALLSGVRTLSRRWRTSGAEAATAARAAEERLRRAQLLTLQARQEATLAREGQRRQEVLNWINLTAGLTHSIGNEVLAFDHYSQVVLDYLSGAEGVPAETLDSIQFIHDTNRARLGFIHFLQEFAEMMKLSADQRQVPPGLCEIPLHATIHGVREKVGRFESRELDAADDDPQIQLQLRKNLELGLIIHFAKGAPRSLKRGRRPVLEFIFYEFIKNSLRNCSGERRLKVHVARAGEDVRIRFINDLDVEVKRPAAGRQALRCSSCQAQVEALWWLKNSDFLDAFCEPCLQRRVEDNLTHSWTPGRTSQGGKGLGLFVIRHFLQRYYFGRTTAGVLNWETREVYFEVEIPDDLEARIRRHNHEVGHGTGARS